MRSDMKDVLRQSKRRKTNACFKHHRHDKNYQFSFDGNNIDDLESDSRIRESMTCRRSKGSYYRRVYNMKAYMFENYLRSQAGRNWNDVYSDICATFKGNGFITHCLKRRIDWYVETNVKQNADGTLYIGHSTTSLVSNTRWLHLYVHPETNILTINDAYVQKQIANDDKDKVLNCLRISKNTYLLQKQGVWYEVRYEKQEVLHYQTAKNVSESYSERYVYPWTRKKNRAPCPRDNMHVAITSIVSESALKFAKDVFGHDATSVAGELVAVHRRTLNFRQLKRYNLADYGFNND